MAHQLGIDFNTEEGEFWDSCYEIMRDHIIQIDLPRALRSLPSFEISPESARQTNLDKLCNFIEKSDNKTLNCNIAFVKSRNLVVVFYSQMDKCHPFVDLKKIFPDAAFNPKFRFLLPGSTYEYSKLDSETTQCAATRVPFQDIDDDLKKCLFARYGLLNTKKTCDEKSIQGFMKDYYKVSERMSWEESKIIVYGYKIQIS